MCEEVKQALKENGYELFAFIGKGGFAECYDVLSVQYNIHFACKVMSLKGKKGSLALKSFMNEINTLTNVIHPYIMPVYNTFTSNSYLYLILEYCPNGDLHDYVKKKGPFRNDSVLLRYVSAILDSLTYLEQNNIAHKDIKPSNILIDSHGHPKLSDFGLASFIEEDRLSEDFSGSLAFCPPELLQRKPFNPMKADIWSFGVTLYYLATGVYPFSTNALKNLGKHISSVVYSLPENINKVIRHIISQSLCINPDERITFSKMKGLVNDEMKRICPEHKKFISLSRMRTAGIYSVQMLSKQKNPLKKEMPSTHTLSFDSI